MNTNVFLSSSKMKSVTQYKRKKNNRNVAHTKKKGRCENNDISFPPIGDETPGKPQDSENASSESKLGRPVISVIQRENSQSEKVKAENGVKSSSSKEFLSKEGKYIPTSKKITVREQCLSVRQDCDVANLQCLTCHTTFTSVKTLYFHMTSIHAEKRIHYQCPLCGVVFVQLWSVSRHLSSVHRKTKEEVNALVSAVRTNTVVYSKQEQQVRMRKKECDMTKRVKEVADYERLQCKQCSQRFSTAANLKRHAARHLGWARYFCVLCTFKAFNFSDCRNHLSKKHCLKNAIEEFIVVSDNSWMLPEG